MVNELKSVSESLTAEEMKELLDNLEKAMEDGEITSGEIADALSGIQNGDAQMASATISASASSNPSSSSSASSTPSPSSTPSAGNGSGNGTGSGSGMGQGSGGGWNMGSSEGLERKEQPDKGEVVHLTGKKEGNDDNLTGKKNGDAKITQKDGQKGGASSGIKADLDSVIGEYSSEAYAKVNSNKVPSAMKDVVKEYFSGFGQ